MKMAKGKEGRKKKKEKGVIGSDGEEDKEERVPEEGEGKTLVVGVRKDGKSRELLTWALVKVAQPRDRVVALHVLLDPDVPPSPPASADSGEECDPVLSLAEGYENMLNAYEGFCNLQQIDLTLKICKGSSVKKVLVRETKAFAASKLIVGVDSVDDGSGSSVTVAKYCAKKLPRDCTVMAVGNGKVVFQREEAGGHHHRLSLLSLTLTHLRSRKDPSEPLCSADGELYCVLPPRDDWGRNADSARPRQQSSFDGTVTDENPSTTRDASPEESCSLCAPVSEPPCSSESKEGELSALNLVPTSETPSSISFSPKQSPDARHGWPVFWRAKLVNTKSRLPPEKNKMSVLQWALRLPVRYSLVHPDRKAIKLDFAPTHDSDGESGGGGIAVGIDSPRTRNAMQMQIVDGKLPKELESLHEKYSSVCKIFSYEELMNATSNFSPDRLIGKGGSSEVYKGCLADGKELAVKILMPSEDALNGFLSELEIITTLRHKNIVSFHGFCFENNSLALVYDYLSRGSLEGILHGDKENKNVLSWPDRYKVAIGAADALDYLHSGGSGKPVIHKDVKSSNILLSGVFEPQLSDFGLAQFALSSTSHITCEDVAGTFGYLAPEYFVYGKVNEKVDVYAFGVVLLELLTGRKPITAGGEKGQESLVMWAKPILRGGEAEKLVDPCLGNEYDGDQLERMILAASLCIRVSYQCRPEMALVLKLLQGDDEVVSSARSQVSASEVCDGLDDEVVFAESDIQSHLSLALLEEEDDSLSTSSTEHTVDCATNTSLEDDTQGRWSRSSSFN